MKVEELSVIQSDNCDSKDYVTKYRKSVTYKATTEYDTSKVFIIKIDYWQDNNCSSSPTDLSLYCLTPSGWTLLGTSYSINREKSEIFQNECRLACVKENCELWFDACLKYFDNVHKAL